MDLVFSWFADKGAWPEHTRAGAAALDSEVVGPNGLLDHVETMLGVGQPDVAAVKRIAVYRQKIESAGPNRFWSKSFASDPWSSARELLHWRDELVEAGWRPGIGLERRRLANLTAAETSGPVLPSGRADRLRGAIDVLRDGRSVRLRSIAVVDDRAALPVGWRALLDALEQRGVRIDQVTRPSSAAAPGSDLARTALGDRENALAGDRSLVLLTADTEQAAAAAVSAWLAADAEANAGVTFVLGGDTSLLDHMLARHRLPRLGATLASPQRALLQVLPLAYALAWDPPDPNRLLDFLLLPISPLRRSAANRLADVVAENPGVGGENWLAAWREINENLSKEEEWADPKKREVRIAEWREFVEPGRHDPAKGMPRVVARGIAERVKAWAVKRHARTENPLLLSLAQSASDLSQAIEATGLERVDRLLIERMIEEAVDVGAVDPSSVAEAAPWRAVSHPGAVWGTSRTIVWWGFVDSDETKPQERWNEAERAALAEAGCPLDPPEVELRRLVDAWERPLNHAAERLMLVVPGQMRGTDTAIHPLWHSVAAGRNGLSARLSARAEDVFSNPKMELGGRTLLRLPVAPATPPGTRTEWSAPAGVIRPREFESASSISSLLSCPFRWTLQYVSRLRPGPRQSIPHVETLIGAIAHKIAAEVFKPGAFPPPEEVGAIARARFDELLPLMGATLLLPGAASELAFARQYVPPALVDLGRFLSSEGLTVVAMEEEIKEADTLAPGAGVSGRIDLHARDAVGKDAVVDLKWYRTDAYLRRDLKLGVAMQIAIYARHISDERVDTHAGYFALRQRRFLATAPISGGSSEIIAGLTPKETWERVLNSFTAAVSDLSSGRVRAAQDGAKTQPERFSDEYLLAPPNCANCEFEGICRAAA
jgi:hypothetical protein